METRQRQESEIEKNIPCEPSFFLLSLNFLFQRCFKESITALYDHLENVLETKF